VRKSRQRLSQGGKKKKTHIFEGKQSGAPTVENVVPEQHKGGERGGGGCAGSL